MECENFWPSLKVPLPPITDADLEYLFMIDKEEILWRDSQPNYSFQELMKIYGPECFKVARRGLKDKLKAEKQRLRLLQTWEEEYYENIICKIPWQERPEIQEESNKDFEIIRDRITSKIKTIMFNFSYLNELEGKAGPKQMGGFGEAEIQRAKEISICNFYTDKLQKHKNLAVGRCPFHGEKTGSFTIYLDQNSWWCYGCNSGGSVIDFIMQQNRCDFLSAVKFLLK
jgi:hypothetical protein